MQNIIINKYMAPIFLGFTASIVFFLNSCATYKAHSDSKKSPDDLAILHQTTGAAILSHRPKVRRIDGKELGYYANTTFELLPGKHRLFVACDPRMSTIYTKWPAGGTLELNMEAGHHYKIFCDIHDGESKYWIENKTTGSVVITVLGGAIDDAWQLKHDIGIYCPNADNGQPDAQTKIGDIYFEGKAIHKNLIQAFVWYSLGAKGGNSHAEEQLNQVKAQLSPDQTIEANNKLQEWSPGHCQTDLLSAAHNK